MAEPALHEQLKQHFARRVSRQSTIVIKLYRQCQTANWSDLQLSAKLLAESEKLTLFAKHFKLERVEGCGYQLSSLLKLCNFLPNDSQTVLKALDNAIKHLTLFIKQEQSQQQKQSASKHITIALNNDTISTQLKKEFEMQGFEAELFDTNTVPTNTPESCILVLDVDFLKPAGGFELAKTLLSNDQSSVQLFFVSFDKNDTSIRLNAIRCGGQAFLYKPASARQILDEILKQDPDSDLNGARVLIVDDSPSQAKYTENILIKHDIECRPLLEPLQLCDALTSFRPNIVLMDMYMPECNGLELATVIRQHSDFKQIPVIFLSAEDDPTLQQQAALLSDAAFLEKPTKPEILLSAIEKALA